MDHCQAEMGQFSGCEVPVVGQHPTDLTVGLILGDVCPVWVPGLHNLLEIVPVNGSED